MKGLVIALLYLLAAFSSAWAASAPKIKQLKVTTANNKLSITIDYSNGVLIKQLTLNGQDLLSPSGIYTSFTLPSGKNFSSMDGKTATIKQSGEKIIIENIAYGNDSLRLIETWIFSKTRNKIRWTIQRRYSNDAKLDDTAFPKWSFANLTTWKGGILDNGGMIWCKYLKGTNDTYGVHTGGVTFWNMNSNDGLRITAQAKLNEIATRYSHSPQNEFTVNHLVTDAALQQRYNLSRFVAGKAEVFAPFTVHKGITTVSYDLACINYPKEYSRGSLTAIDSISVRELLNTTARYGVVDNSIVGGNGWLSNWKCLHEPFFAQIALAVDDSNYTRNLSKSLDREQRLAILPNGRVLSRWHDVPGDEIPGTYNKKTGYYEAVWGYTIDSQTGYVITTCEQFDLVGDRAWLGSHKQTCEKALDWLIARDSNHNDIYEMMNKGIGDKKSSDWLDIVWASFENAFVNAQLYQALKLWADCEKVLGDNPKSRYYQRLASRLKIAFNKPVEEGGFWSETKGQYSYWRDSDGSIHGDNLVTPVNFAAIAFGLCDDPRRIGIILDKIEQRMQNEHLFHWPLCFDSFKKDEVSEGNWPFPRYENGDIFPSWGYLGINAYTKYKTPIAIKYLHQLLQQYQKDGLSSQRYDRSTQLGLGDDILSGICTSITALYKDIYGIRPKWNRMGLEPNIDSSLNGAAFDYQLRGTRYHVLLDKDAYQLSAKNFSINSSESFGASQTGRTLRYYHLNNDSCTLTFTAAAAKPINLRLTEWSANLLVFSVGNTSNITIKGLQPNHYYHVSIDNATHKLATSADGSLAIKSAESITPSNKRSLFSITKVP